MDGVGREKGNDQHHSGIKLIEQIYYFGKYALVSLPLSLFVLVCVLIPG